ncbi:hypothetical protein PHYBLDRAFT_150100 [Phycomyces blakesleeanus NRRL 1555(-)]|uniref:Uncharacterized protein n=1 Tax=Phycomyces blakesleeanus (strain ATCC 8743b / DSM 1359 / FGSC 10004 / NBRC 33097 / NRRL 1555) TaxID=763407 RepID=A0A167KXF5_PHYB8|nr:hypothetical protein PHYBLDRAFT_150100 [Phycomyces blakesleeanus NRRL 1555(-)]OAD69108.1 hypothetical protein PHYBLDRAFT_150100 [Phycomyces blakesleeanus NRRL 1555(-)]|eukprot:XP_018287148.1 hypothetical protein PHYBLDRAFT_150100 [Phycomyces blakesleeanus NRRL 1555(-)]
MGLKATLSSLFVSKVWVVDCLPTICILVSSSTNHYSFLNHRHAANADQEEDVLLLSSSSSNSSSSNSSVLDASLNISSDFLTIRLISAAFASERPIGESVFVVEDIFESSILYLLRTLREHLMPLLSLKLLPDLFSIHQFPRNYKWQSYILDQPWFTLSKTTSELSLILLTTSKLVDIAQKTEDNWRCFKVDAKMDFGLVGILA